MHHRTREVMSIEHYCRGEKISLFSFCVYAMLLLPARMHSVPGMHFSSIHLVLSPLCLTY